MRLPLADAGCPGAADLGRGAGPGGLSDAADPAGGRLRRRRADRHSGALHRRQARRGAAPAGGGGEQAGSGRNAGDQGRARPGARRLPSAALHAFRADQCRRLQEPQFKLGDLAPISLVTKYYYGLALANSIPADDLAAFVQYAKARPGEISYATIGAGSAQEILARQLEKLTGISMNRIPFRGGPQVVQELIAGRVHFYVSPTLAIAPQYQAKQLRILAVSAPERLKSLPEVPTLSGARHRLRAFRLARRLRRRRHPAADRRSAAAPCRGDRRHARIPRVDRERRIDSSVVDAAGAAASDRADARRVAASIREFGMQLDQ